MMSNPKPGSFPAGRLRGFLQPAVRASKQNERPGAATGNTSASITQIYNGERRGGDNFLLGHSG